MKVVVATTISAALLLGACGGSDNPSGSSGGNRGDGQASSPLASFLGIDDSIDMDSPEAQERMIAEAREVNEWVVTCMAAKGWDYIPENPEDFVMYDSVDADGLDPNSREYVAKYGFGYSTQRWSQVTVGPELVGYDDSMRGRTYVDPNADYLKTLSEVEQEAFSRDLHGTWPDYIWDETLSDEENNERWNELYADFVPTGCQNEAWAEMGGPDNERAQAFGDRFNDELRQMYEEIERDPRIAEHQDMVRACVTDQGQEYVPEDSIWELWDADLNTIDENHVVHPGMDLTEAQQEAMTDEDWQELWNEPATMSDEGKALLAEIQADEQALALVYFDCGGQQSRLQELWEELRIEYEQRFLETHADALADFEGGS